MEKTGFNRCRFKGNWKIKLATLKAGGPYPIRIQTADSTIAINDVLIGEVCLASGQSNMDLPLKGWLPNDTVFNCTSQLSGDKIAKSAVQYIGYTY